MFDLPCVVLCGGKSSRMGEDKALLPFSNFNSLAQYQFERLKPYFKNVYLSSKTNKFDFLDERNIILDENKDIYSPILALNTIFKKFPNQKIFIITVDYPFVSIESMKEIIGKSKNVDICIAQTEKTHNLCGIFSSNINFTINNMIEKDIHKVFYLIKNYHYVTINFPNNNEFININNKNEYELALKIIKKSYES